MPAPSAVEQEIPDQDLLRRIGRKVRKRLAANEDVQRIPSDKAELWVVERFFDEIECGRLISMIDAVARPSTAYADAGDIGVRTSYSGDLNPFDPFVRELEQRIDTLLGLDHGTGEILERKPSEHWEIVKISLPADLTRYVVEKGSITVDGISLTVVDAGPDYFTVSLIPTTLDLTTLGHKQPGDPVNLEVDVIAKYVERMLGDRAQGAGR